MPGAPDDDSTLEELPSDGRRPSDHDDVHVVVECDRLDAGSTRHCVDDVDQVVFRRGRERKATRELVSGARTLVLEVPDSRMSARHATMRRIDGHWLLEDDDSRNGSYVHGRRIARARLADGAIFQFGHTHLLFRSRDLPRALVVGPRDIATASSRESAVGVLSHERSGLLARLVDAARGDVPILLIGEAASGKAAMARVVHEAAGNQGPFVVVQCMLVGRAHDSDARGRDVAELQVAFERATRGTLFLDEIDELTVDGQMALLSLLRSTERRRVASIVSSVHSSEGPPRVPHVATDLLAELAVFTMHVPPLRERREDLGALVAEIVRQGDGARRGAIAMDPLMGQALLQHDWPYNLSEFESCIRSAIAMSGDGPMRWSPPSLRYAQPSAAASPQESLESSPRPPRTDPPPPDLSAVVSSEPDAEFSHNVRRALKCNLAVSGLQKNGLLGSHMVLGATKGAVAATSTVPALRSIVLSALEVLGGSSPRGAKQSRVLHLTFIEPTSTQQEAADRLGMAFGTYRRYVTSALAELTSILWFREISARERFAPVASRASDDSPVSSVG